MVLRVLAGCSAAAVSSVAFAAAAEGAPEGKQGTYLLVVTAGLAVALFTGVPVGTWLASLYSWRFAFVFIAVVATIAALIAVVSMPN